MVFGGSIFFVRARQARREMDETMAAESAIPAVSNLDSAGKLEGTVEGSESIGLEKEADVRGRSRQRVGGQDA